MILDHIQIAIRIERYAMFVKNVLISNSLACSEFLLVSFYEQIVLKTPYYHQQCDELDSYIHTSQQK